MRLILKITLMLCVFILNQGFTPEQLSDDELLDLIQRKSFEYFVAESNPSIGIVRDRAHNFSRGKTRAPSSIAATGFALTAYPVGVERGWLDYSEAAEMTRRTLLFFLNQAEHENGFFYHFLNFNTGERIKSSELSPIDTALFLAGALFAAEYFDDEEIRKLASQIYERVNWQWMLNDGKTLALAWSPQSGFEKRRWDHYDESMIMYLLAIGSPSYPIPAESWKEIKRPIGSYKDIPVIQMPPLFTHQYSHIWIDFKNKNDGYADYFLNSVNATKANRQFAIDESVNFKSYGPNSWGLTASDGPFGYKAYGAPPGWAQHDGTIAPTGCGSSIVFTPEESIACLRHFYENLGDRLWGIYGFADAFNLDRDWVAHDVIGIDLGALVLMIENYRSGLIWEVMKKSEPLMQAMKDVGFVEGSLELKLPEPPVYEAQYVEGDISVDGYLRDWGQIVAITLDPNQRELGNFDNEEDLNATVRFLWNEKYLFFSVSANDNDVLVRKKTRNVWMDDALELYIDPEGDGLFWNHEKDYQLGFRAVPDTGEVEAWSWFQGGEDPIGEGHVFVKSFMDHHGYILEGAIRWDFLGVLPEESMTLRLSPALHDIDRDRTEGKLQWFFRNEGGPDRFSLGKIVLVKET